jgi:hypothetical protein
MMNKPFDIAGFLRLVLEALNAAEVEYLIGGAIAEWAWAEPRATGIWIWWSRYLSNPLISFPKSWKSGTCSFQPSLSGYDCGRPGRYPDQRYPHTQWAQSRFVSSARRG